VIKSYPRLVVWSESWGRIVILTCLDRQGREKQIFPILNAQPGLIPAGKDPGAKKKYFNPNII
jgi:hypothetical protein